MERLLPIFPLDMVLLPSASPALHIFEPRYKEMIGECLTQNSPFGIVRAQAGGIANVGCTAEIVEVIKRYEDGRLDILTEGRNRFEILRVNEERSFLRAEVLYFEDEPGEPPGARVKELLRLHGQVAELTGAEFNPEDFAGEDLSFRLSAAVPADSDFQQALLATRSEAERVEMLIKCYEAVLPKLSRAIQARKKAGGNGHIH